MKDRIIAALGDDKLVHIENINYPQIHVIDMTRKTDSKQGIKICEIQPEGIASLLIENPNLDITATLFMPQCFLDKRGYELENCEGVFYLTNSTDDTWVLFLEIKDCESGNISEYFKKSKEQIKSTVQIFRDRKIIDENKRVFANISFPRRSKIDYFNHLIKHEEKKGFLDRYKIFIRGTNKLTIINSKTIS
jgi:hypothetical protein